MRGANISKSTLIILTIGIVGLLVLAGCSNSSPSAPDSPMQTATQKYETKSTGSTDLGDVLVELTPRGVTDGRLEVDIAVNTHSVELAQFDLIEITTLEFNGKRVKPVSAPALAGHHSSGKLVFDVGSRIDAYTITITGIPEVERRTFTWDNKT